MSYLPIGAEADPHEAAEAARRSGRALFYTDSGADLALRAAVPGRVEPAEVAGLDAPETLFLIPGVAFDESGGRLGRGVGWYDRLLARFSHASRCGLAFALQVQVQIVLRELQEQVREAGLADDPVVRQRFAQLYIEAQVLRLNAYRGLTGTMKRGAPGPEGSLGKWHWAEVNQSLAELGIDVTGANALVAVPVSLAASVSGSPLGA